MADRTHIEWTDATWNPIVGCTRVSEGCRNCYAEVMAARFNQPGQWGHGLARTVDTPTGKDHRWTGKAPRFRPDTLRAPLRWQKPRRIFVCSTSDLFHEEVRDEWIDQIFAVMAITPWHTYQVLTKRPERMRDYLAESWQPAPAREVRIAGEVVHVQAEGRRSDRWDRINEAIDAIRLPPRDARFWDADDRLIGRPAWPRRPLPNVWLGTSVEDQATADARVPLLLDTPAALHWVSYEPALGPVDFSAIDISGDEEILPLGAEWLDRLEPGEVEGPRLGWIVMGGESGPGARPMHPDWARQTRDQCAAAGVPFLFKQWGHWQDGSNFSRKAMAVTSDGRAIAFNREALAAADRVAPIGNPTLMSPIGKRAAGRLLDGVLHDEYPGVCW